MSQTTTRSSATECSNYRTLWQVAHNTAAQGARSHPLCGGASRCPPPRWDMRTEHAHRDLGLAEEKVRRELVEIAATYFRLVTGFALLLPVASCAGCTGLPAAPYGGAVCRVDGFDAGTTGSDEARASRRANPCGLREKA